MRTSLAIVIVVFLVLVQSVTASAQTTVYLPVVATAGTGQQLIELESLEAGEALLQSMKLSENEYQQFHTQLQQMFNESDAGSNLDQSVLPAGSNATNGIISKVLNCPTGKGAIQWLTTGTGWIAAQYARFPVESPVWPAVCSKAQCYYAHVIDGLAGSYIYGHVLSTQFVGAYNAGGCVG